jgi:hypothetical protein
MQVRGKGGREMKRFLAILLAATLTLVCLGVRSGYAGEIDILLQKLVEKGVLTAGEAQEIKTETKEEMRKEIAQAKYDLLPEWVQRVKFKGDFRLRYQWDKDKGQEDNNRARIRVRLGTDVKVNDQMKVGVGIATGRTSDPRSTNATLGNSSTSNTPAAFKDIILDYAYGQYNPTTWLTLTAGKFKNPIWQPNDTLWDTDLNPEGAVVQFDYRLNPTVGLFGNVMYFWMRNDARADKQPMMFAIQPGANFTFRDKYNLKAALTDYVFMGVRNTAAFSQRATNSLNANGTYKYNYNSINPNFEFGVKDPFAGINDFLAMRIPYASIFADYIYNYSPDVTSSKDGWDVGIKFGHEKVGDWKQWQAKLLFARLGRDAWLDIFPDSDRYGGKTNMKSYEAIYEFGLGKNTSLALDYYYAENLTKTGVAKYSPQQVLQVDWNLKW